MLKYLIKLMHYTRDNRWTILTLVISVVMVITIGRNAWHGVIISTQIAELEHERDIYREEIKRDSTLIERLKDNDELARYAREKYYMRREGEDLFILK